MAVLPAAQAHFEWRIEVVVIGAGACGLTAALAASEAGADVMVLERDARPSGSTALSTGLIPAARTRLQRAAGIEDSAELLAQDMLGKARHQTDPQIVRAVASAAGPTVDWLTEKHGLTLTLVDGYLYPGHSVRRMHGTPNRTGRELESALLAATEHRGIELLCNATVTDLYATTDGRITAVRCSRPDGSTETIGCDAVVLACCGFGGNSAMVRELIPEIANARYWGHAGNQGDAIRWGRALGAALADLGSYQGHGAVATPYGTPINWAVLTEGGFMVNALGERFSDEVRGYSEQAIETISQPGGFAWNVYDETREQPVLGFSDYKAVLDLGGIRRASSVAELAGLTALPAEALERTFREVQQMCAGVREDPFGRDFSTKRPLDAPFCAVKVTGALFHTQGGLVVDESARVLREDGSRMPNLFAGGGAARGFSGPSRWGYFSGSGLMSAVTLGRLAGTGAAGIAHGTST